MVWAGLGGLAVVDLPQSTTAAFFCRKQQHKSTKSTKHKSAKVQKSTKAQKQKSARQTQSIKVQESRLTGMCYSSCGAKHKVQSPKAQRQTQSTKVQEQTGGDVSSCGAWDEHWMTWAGLGGLAVVDLPKHKSTKVQKAAAQKHKVQSTECKVQKKHKGRFKAQKCKSFKRRERMADAIALRMRKFQLDWTVVVCEKTHFKTINLCSSARKKAPRMRRDAVRATVARSTQNCRDTRARDMHEKVCLVDCCVFDLCPPPRIGRQ